MKHGDAPVTAETAGHQRDDQTSNALVSATDGGLGDDLNAQVLSLLADTWPLLYRTLSRMARKRWEIAPIGSAPQRRWRITSTLRLLEPPHPTATERLLGSACACVHVEAQCALRGAIEGWTVSLRAYPDHQEVQVSGATTQISSDLAGEHLRRLLQTAERAGPGYYKLRTPQMSAAALRRHLRTAPAASDVTPADSSAAEAPQSLV